MGAGTCVCKTLGVLSLPVDIDRNLAIKDWTSSGGGGGGNITIGFHDLSLPPLVLGQ